VRSPVLLAALVGAALLVPAGAASATITRQTIGPPNVSPVAFAKIKSGGVAGRALAKGTKLKSGQRIIVLTYSGKDRPPNTCGGCFAQSWQNPSSFGLASGYVRARSPSGATLAVAPPADMFIASNGPNDAALQFDWPANTKKFPPGSKVVAYGLFIKGLSGGPGNR
jgi:hypothetical protein